MSRPKRSYIPTEALFDAARRASERLGHLSRDPDVRREAGNVAQAMSRLLDAIKKSGQTPRE
ncbi:hypothetical protein [Deinococcus sp.]|uniref:hypothetical protein n=1 Tax=Deinococcus sp. TaxID=47478 RepID=UPI00286981DE|nr:hypothetical protein [Deinococcus sp.]